MVHELSLYYFLNCMCIYNDHKIKSLIKKIFFTLPPSPPSGQPSEAVWSLSKNTALSSKG